MDKRLQSRQGSDGTFEFFVDDFEQGLNEISESEVSYAEVVPSEPIAVARKSKLPIVIGAGLVVLAIVAVGTAFVFLDSPDSPEQSADTLPVVSGFKPYNGVAASARKAKKPTIKPSKVVTPKVAVVETDGEESDSFESEEIVMGKDVLDEDENERVEEIEVDEDVEDEATVLRVGQARKTPPNLEGERTEDQGDNEVIDIGRPKRTNFPVKLNTKLQRDFVRPEIRPRAFPTKIPTKTTWQKLTNDGADGDGFRDGDDEPAVENDE